MRDAANAARAVEDAREAREWLEGNRCPHCVHSGRCKGYKVRRAHAGWQCHGYRSRYWEEGLGLWQAEGKVEP